MGRRVVSYPCRGASFFRATSQSNPGRPSRDRQVHRAGCVEGGPWIGALWTHCARGNHTCNRPIDMEAPRSEGREVQVRNSSGSTDDRNTTEECCGWSEKIPGSAGFSRTHFLQILTVLFG